jgi:3-deoxy-D-manno-octulosonic-acid transferase
MRILLWPLYYPLLKLLSFFVSWIPEFQLRKRFEKKNATEALCESFKQKGLVADFCFEFSSEGEYQQVASLIDDALCAGKRLELVFFSPSVEKTIVTLALRWPEHVRYLRYPLVQFSPWGKGRSFSRWVTSKKLIMVRYDLFPEFLAWAQGRGNELTLLWMTFKKERVKKKKISWSKMAFLKVAKKIVYASLPDQQMGNAMNFPGLYHDFRMEQIKRRVALRIEKFELVFPQYSELKKCWEKFPPAKRLIFGNAWPSDLFLLDHLPEDIFLLVVPHQLTPEIMKAFSKGLARLGRDVVELSEGSEVCPGDTFILNKKGVLCELYTDFNLAYVGGGFEAGVHSLLEPLVAGRAAIACGELHQRSTEFDVANALGVVTEVKTTHAFAKWLDDVHSANNDKELTELFTKYEKFRKDVISC